jgi:hypothetical protein
LNLTYSLVKEHLGSEKRAKEVRCYPGHFGRSPFWSATLIVIEGRRSERQAGKKQLAQSFALRLLFWALVNSLPNFRTSRDVHQHAVGLRTRDHIDCMSLVKQTPHISTSLPTIAAKSALRGLPLSAGDPTRA